MLTLFEMREQSAPRLTYGTDPEEVNLNLNSLTYKPPVPQPHETLLMERRRRITEGIKGVWYRFDEQFLIPYFGGEQILTRNIERLESQSSNNRNDSFHNNGTNGDVTPWSPTGDFEMEKVNGNSFGNTTNRTIAETQNRSESVEEEMISLTSSFDVEPE